MLPTEGDASMLPTETVSVRGPYAPAMAPAESTDDTDGDSEPSLSELRAEVEEKYDFESFGPAEMDEMEPKEWVAAFDAKTWITGDRLLDRLEADLRQRVADRDVFARIEREDDRILAYSDESYAIVYADGSVEGEGTVRRDVEPSVALCSMESYEVPEPPTGDVLPDPDEVAESEGELGNVMVQLLSIVQLLAGVVLVAYGFTGNGIAFVAGLFLLGIGLFLLVVVANARLSEAFRADAYRTRLRKMGAASDERPSFVPDRNPAAADGPGQMNERNQDEDQLHASDTTDGRAAGKADDG